MAKLGTFSIKQASDMTGCVSRCTFEKYSLEPWRTKPASDAGRSTFHLYHYLGEIVVEEEFYLYDGDNLIADVGGYLGLLLGVCLNWLFDV